MNQISKEEMKKCVKSTHIINKPNLNFMGEEEIVAAEKKYEAILNYCLSNPNTPKYTKKILNYETKMRNNKKKHFRDLVAKGKRFKAEILQRDGKEERVLYRNWEFNNNEEEEKESIKWMRYPREFEAREIMLKAHTDTGSHLTIHRTIQKIVEMGYKWDKMANDVRQMFYKWEFWIGHIKMPKKKIAYKHIESNYPKERYQVDTTMLYDHIPADNRNLLTMVDHFSKFGRVVSIPNKKSQIVLDAIKLWFALHGKPDSLQSDNGTEFVNSTLKTYLEKEGVNHIRGSPYHPQSQGAVEAFNKTILKFLYLAYDENNDTFELNRAITDFLLYYNGRKHTTTKYSPYEIMGKRFQETFLSKVLENTIKSRKNHRIEKYQINQEVRISSFIIQPLKEKIT